MARVERRAANGSIDEHEAVLSAILTGDCEEGHRLMRAHVSLLGDRFADLISSLPHGFGLATGEPVLVPIATGTRRDRRKTSVAL